MRLVLLCAAAVLLAGRAIAADEPVYAPEAGWVRPLPVPTVAPSDDGSPIQMLLIDRQSRLGATSDERYQRSVFRILSPQGLGASGQIAKNWDPATETLTIHHLNVIHNGKVIDALANGTKFLVLRRENNLELAVLDGRLTATIQPEGLEVGDVVDEAFTLSHSDPALGGHSADFDALTHTGVAGRVHFRELWPASKPVRWRQTVGIDAPKLTHTADGTEAVVDLTAVTTPKPPTGAPGRFQQVGTLEFSDFADWSGVSSLMAPLYQKAETLRPDSPLREEIARIAAASSDPTVRASAALRMVEDRTRYVFLGMNDAGLIPAAADETWARRFGDCKGKSVLLVAVLRALGLDAVPAAVSTQVGDGMDKRLPNIGWFDHVIVRLRIAGKTYWLDGTGQADLKLDDLTIPNYHWALPIVPGGAELTPLDPPPLEAPLFETLVRIDASKGMEALAPTHVEFTYRGEMAVAARLSIMSATHADYDRSVREMLTKAFPSLTVDKVGVVREDDANQVRLTGDGVTKVNWGASPDGSSFYDAPGTSMGNDTAFRREPGPNSDAPYAVPYPTFARSVQEVILPGGGAFTLVGPDVEATVAGQELKRNSRIEKGVLRVQMSVRSVAPELPAAEAEAANSAMRALPRGEVVAIFRPGATPPPVQAGSTSTDMDADRRGAELGDAAAQYRLGMMDLRGEGVPLDIDQGASWIRRAADHGYAKAQLALGGLYMLGRGVPSNPTEGVGWIRKAADQGDRDAELAIGKLYRQGLGAPHDDVQALSWFKKAADQGDAEAQVELAIAYELGRGAPRDYGLALATFQKAADQGNANAADGIGQMYANGRGVPQDVAKAFTWFTKSAERGSASGQNDLGIAYQYGRGAPADYGKAIEQFGKAAAQDDPTAQGNLGLIYLNAIAYRDYAKAMALFTKAAAHRNARAEFNLGEMYLAGKGVTADPAQARAWLNRAAADGSPDASFALSKLDAAPARIEQTPDRSFLHGLAQAGGSGLNDGQMNFHPTVRYEPPALAAGPPPADQTAADRKAAEGGDRIAQYRLGQRYGTGLGVPKDDIQAAAWLRKAADQGQSDAQAELAAFYDEGRGVAKDSGLALAWYQKAADQGNAIAEVAIGVRLYRGEGSPADHAKAVDWFRKAAEQGNAAAERCLGLSYERGDGVGVDRAAAIVWLGRAAAQGDDFAVKELKALKASG